MTKTRRQRTCKQVVDRIQFRQDRLVRMKAKGMPNNLIVSELRIIDFLFKQLRNKLAFLTRCGIPASMIQ